MLAGPEGRGWSCEQGVRSVSRELLSSSCKFLSVKRFGTETFGLIFCQQWEMVVEADPGA